MGTEKLKRVCLLLKEQHPTNIFSKSDVEQAIMVEIGTCARTILDNWNALRKLKYIRGRYQKKKYFVTNKV